MMEQRFLQETEMVNYNSDSIKSLVQVNGWNKLDNFSKIDAIYDFVQNKILFGYNADDTLSAAEVLKDGIGQCNTKSTLLMALLRAVNIPCRLHASKVTKDFQKGATSGIIAKLAPQYILHTWVEVYYGTTWVSLEGVILDKKYLSALQQKYPNQKGLFKGYVVATNCFENPPIDWKGNDTFIQREAVAFDFGLYASPDEFFSQHKQEICIIKHFLYIHIGRHIMTMNIAKIRGKATLQR